MSAERPCVVILSSIDWGSAWQRHQIFAAQFAAAGYPVLFVESTGFRNPGIADFPRVWKKLRGWFETKKAPPSLPPGVRLVRPRMLPPTGIFRKLNAAVFIPKLIRELRSLGADDKSIAIFYLPSTTTLAILERLSPAKTVFDCASNFRAHEQAPADFAQIERRLLDRADLVVCDSDFLFEQKKAEHRRVIQVHQGVSEAFFKTGPPSGQWKRFCYYGSWTPDMDEGYLNALAEAGFSVTVSGFIRGGLPKFHPSIEVLGPVEPDELPRRLEKFDVFMFPHKITPFHLGVVPAKLYECFAMGRPVLAAPLPSLKPFEKLLYIAPTAQEWVRKAQILSLTENDSIRKERIDLAKQHTHAVEFSRLLSEIQSI